MSPNTSEQPLPKLTPLPSLTVVRETWCPQILTDTLCRFLEERRPELIRELAGYLLNHQNDSYRRLIENTYYYIKTEAAKQIPVPETRLGKLDFLFELGRRIANACGVEDAGVAGNPLVNDPREKFPPLGSGKASAPKFGVTREMADKASQLVYDQRPDIVYEIAEMMRRDLYLSEINGQFYTFVKQELRSPLALPDSPAAETELLRDLQYRLRRMMSLPLLDQPQQKE